MGILALGDGSTEWELPVNSQSTVSQDSGLFYLPAMSRHPKRLLTYVSSCRPMNMKMQELLPEGPVAIQP